METKFLQKNPLVQPIMPKNILFYFIVKNDFFVLAVNPLHFCSVLKNLQCVYPLKLFMPLKCTKKQLIVRENPNVIMILINFNTQFLIVALLKISTRPFGSSHGYYYIGREFLSIKGFVQKTAYEWHN